MTRVELAAVPAVYDASHYPIFDLERAWTAAGGRVEGALGPRHFVAGRLAQKVGANRPIRRGRQPARIAPLMGPREQWLFPHTLHHEIIPLCWDVWEPDFGRWEEIFKRHRVRRALMTARSSAEWWSQKSDIDARWLPEATTPRIPTPRPLSERGIAILELGRNHPPLHQRLVEAFAPTPWLHLYEARPGERIFGSREDMLAGLADAVISVCLPRSVTHPHVAGGTLAMTHRYLETMLAGAVPLGHAPPEMVDLFGYNPILEIEWTDPVAQCLHVLNHPARYQTLVDRNREAVVRVGSWQSRLHDLVNILQTWDLTPAIAEAGASARAGH